MNQLDVRIAREADADSLARLAAQLGYPVDAATMRRRLRQILARADQIVVVAETPLEGVIAWIHGFLSQPLESEARVEIAGLVVDERFHRKGVGKELISRVENWAKEKGVTQSSVRCQIKRTEAHRFYESLGYRPAKTQIAFRKALR